MAINTNKPSSLSGQPEKRREERFGVPGRCQGYLSLHVKTGGSHIPAVLANFSRNGILFESTLPLETGACTECILSLSLLLNRVISFWITVKYCYKNDNSYIIGAEISTITDHAWFDFFEEIYDFIVVNKESV
jgi:hypothetical protein